MPSTVRPRLAQAAVTALLALLTASTLGCDVQHYNLSQDAPPPAPAASPAAPAVPADGGSPGSPGNSGIPGIPGIPNPRTAQLAPSRPPKTGECECPYDLMASGATCGGRSAYSRGGGEQPACYVGEVAGSSPAPNTLGTPTAQVSPASPASPASSSPHLRFGNPSRAGRQDRNNYLLDKPEYALAYNCSLGTANWAAWQLTPRWLGSTERRDDFRPDPAVPCYQVRPNDYRGSGYDRGHLVPSGDRTASAAENSSTFVMSNMIPQHPENNRELWRELEEYSRELVAQGKALYLVAGGIPSSQAIAGGQVRVPQYTWKAILILNAPDGSPERMLAVRIPNDASVIGRRWQDYQVTVDALESQTGYDLFSALPPQVEDELEMRVD